MNEKELTLYETAFALDDLVLYLDTHPKDAEALAHYEKVRVDWKQARCEYVANVGPLTAADVTAENEWTWIESPWPWEGGMCACGITKNDCNTR